MATIQDVTTVMLSTALDATVMRQQAIAQNIANANTPGYRHLAVQFEAELSKALRSSRPDAAAGVVPRLVEAPRALGNEGTDLELAQLSETVLHHRALVTILDKRVAILNTAIKEGKQ